MKKRDKHEGNEEQPILNDPAAIYSRTSGEHELIVTKMPCDFTEEEILQACESSIQEFESGMLINSSQIKRKIS